MPFLKDFVFCMTGHFLGRKVIIHDMGQYLRELDLALKPLPQKLLRFMMRRVYASIVLGEVTRKVYEGYMNINRVFAVPGAVADSKFLPGDKIPGDHIQVLYFSFLRKI
jgi:hypothetical protein